jgi:hypothetical protein
MSAWINLMRERVNSGSDAGFQDSILGQVRTATLGQGRLDNPCLFHNNLPLAFLEGKRLEEDSRDQAIHRHLDSLQSLEQGQLN